MDVIVSDRHDGEAVLNASMELTSREISVSTSITPRDYAYKLLSYRINKRSARITLDCKKKSKNWMHDENEVQVTPPGYWTVKEMANKK